MSSSCPPQYVDPYSIEYAGAGGYDDAVNKNNEMYTACQKEHLTCKAVGCDKCSRMTGTKTVTHGTCKKPAEKQSYSNPFATRLAASTASTLATNAIDELDSSTQQKCECTATNFQSSRNSQSSSVNTACTAAADCAKPLTTTSYITYGDGTCSKIVQAYNKGVTCPTSKTPSPPCNGNCPLPKVSVGTTTGSDDVPWKGVNYRGGD